MSLLPIIYSSILIFSGILVFVVILSYVSFTVKEDESYFEEEEKVKHNISIPPIRQQRKETVKSTDSYNENKAIKMKDLYGEKMKYISPLTKSEYRKKTKRLNDKNMQVHYKEKDLFNRSKPRIHEPRFSIVKDISEHLVKIERDELKTEAASYQTAHMTEVGSVDYLRYYENY
jgi:hypothetical protein